MDTRRTTSEFLNAINQKLMKSSEYVKCKLKLKKNNGDKSVNVECKQKI